MKKLNVGQQPHENISKMVAHLNGRNGTETRLCDVTVVLKVAVFLHELLMVKGSKNKPHFAW